MSRLIAALGNPGTDYQKTRHNIGQQVLEYLSFYSHLNWSQKFKGFYCSYEIDGSKTHIIKPQTYMNLSGKSVAPLVNFFKIDPSDVLVLHDELDLDFGVIAFKDGGGLAGHNGLKSVAQDLGTQDFKRLRIGIGRPPHGSVSNWVLSSYAHDQLPWLEDYFSGVAAAVEYYLEYGFAKAQNKFSKKEIININ